MMMTSSSFTAGREPLPDDVACAVGTCVTAMTQLRVLYMHDLSLQVLKTLPERMETLQDLVVFPPGVNWVSGNVCVCVYVCVCLSDYCVFFRGFVSSLDCLNLCVYC